MRQQGENTTKRERERVKLVAAAFFNLVHLEISCVFDGELLWHGREFNCNLKRPKK